MRDWAADWSWSCDELQLRRPGSSNTCTVWPDSKFINSNLNRICVIRNIRHKHLWVKNSKVDFFFDPMMQVKMHVWGWVAPVQMVSCVVCVWRHCQAITQFLLVAFDGACLSHTCRDMTNITWPKQEAWGRNSLNQEGGVWLGAGGARDERNLGTPVLNKQSCSSYFWFLRFHTSDSLSSIWMIYSHSQQQIAFVVKWVRSNFKFSLPPVLFSIFISLF